jgi:excisionase family DNA binding protein
LTVKQTAERLGISPGLVYALVAAGKLTHRRIGLGRGKILFAEEDVASFLDAIKVGARETASAPPPPSGRPRPIRLKNLRFS